MARHGQHDLRGHRLACDFAATCSTSPTPRSEATQIESCYRAHSQDRERIDNGVDWLRRHFTVQGNPSSSARHSRLWHYYYLYGLERAGRLSARRKIGEHDWYREGAKFLVRAIGSKT